MTYGEDCQEGSVSDDILLELATIKKDHSHARERITELEAAHDRFRTAVVDSAVHGLEDFQKLSMKEMKILAARVEENRTTVSRVNRRVDALSEDTARIVVRLEDLKELLEGLDTVTLANGIAKNAELSGNNAESLKKVASLLSSLERALKREAGALRDDLGRVDRELTIVRQLESRIGILESHKDDLDDKVDDLSGRLELVHARLSPDEGDAVPVAYERLSSQRQKLERRLDDVVDHLKRRSGRA